MSAVTELVEKIEKLTLLEAAELKKALEEKFGVTAAAPMMMAGPAAAAAAPVVRKARKQIERSRRAKNQRHQSRPCSNGARLERGKGPR